MMGKAAVMKKRIMAMLCASLLLFGAAACGEKAETETESAASNKRTEVTAEDYSGALTESGYIIGLTAADYYKVPEDWMELSIEKSKVAPPESTVESAVSTIMSQFPIKITDRAVEDGDLVNLDYEGKLDGVAFEGGAAQGADLTAGAETFVDNFLSKIIGHMPGETFDIEITFPDPYQNNTDLSGKLTIFTVTINYISGGSNEFTDDFVRENLDELRAMVGSDDVEDTEGIREAIRQYYIGQNMEDAIYERLYEIEVESIPEPLYDYVYNMTDISIFNSYSMSIEEMAEKSSMSAEDLKKHVEEDCKPELVFQAIAEKEGWTVTEADFDEALGTGDHSELIDFYGKNYIARYVLTVRALKYLKEHIPLVESESGEE